MTSADHTDRKFVFIPELAHIIAIWSLDELSSIRSVIAPLFRAAMTNEVHKPPSVTELPYDIFFIGERLIRGIESCRSKPCHILDCTVPVIFPFKPCPVRIACLRVSISSDNQHRGEPWLVVHRRFIGDDFFDHDSDFSFTATGKTANRDIRSQIHIYILGILIHVPFSIQTITITIPTRKIPVLIIDVCEIQIAEIPDIPVIHHRNVPHRAIPCWEKLTAPAPHEKDVGDPPFFDRCFYEIFYFLCIIPAVPVHLMIHLGKGH